MHKRVKLSFCVLLRSLGSIGMWLILIRQKDSEVRDGLENAEEVPAQILPHIHLLPANSGLKITLLSRPFTQGRPYFRPGAGGETVIAEIEGKRLQTKRNLSEENQLATAIGFETR